MSRHFLAFLWRRYALLVALCTIPPVFVGTLVGLLYPSYRDKEELLRGLIPFAEKLFGGDVLELFSLQGFFNIPFQHPLTLASFAAAVAIPVLAFPAGERGRGSLDLLPATSLTREQLVGSVALFLVPTALLVAFSPLLGTLVGAWISGVLADLDFGTYALICVNAALLIYWLGAACLLLSVCAARRGQASLWYLVLVVLGVVLTVTDQLWEGHDFLHYFSPFGYYEPPRIAAGVASVGLDALVLGGTGALLLLAALRLQSRRRTV